jgi:hypothetical protein
VLFPSTHAPKLILDLIVSEEGERESESESEREREKEREKA